MVLGEQYEKARKTAYKYLSGRSRTQYQVAEMLYRKGFDMETVGRVTDNLREYGLLNDESFAEYYVRKKSLSSRAAMAEGMKNLGIEEYIIDRVLDGVDSDAELRVAMSLAVAKRKRRGEEYPLANIAAFLRRRGFKQEIVERVCDCLDNMRHP